MKIRLNNTKKGLTTLWSLEKFESAMEQMRELYQQRDNDSVSGESGDEIDPFNDPDDKWEKDFKLDSSSSRRISSISSSGLSSRTRSSAAGKSQGFSANKAESIFAKYRNQQNQGPSSDSPEAPSNDPGPLPERPVEVVSSRPPVALSSRRKSETRRPGPSVASLCRDSLKNYLASSKELSDPLNEPVYEKVLRSVKDIKNSVTVIKKAHQEKTAFDGGTPKEVQLCFLTASFSVQMLTELARIWCTAETQNAHFSDLSFQLVETVKRLGDHVIKIIETLDGSSSNMEDLFTAFSDDVRHVVRHTAKMAVVSSPEEQLTDGDNSTEDDSELNKAFVEGQDMSMEISVRDSISAISEIQEKLQTDSLESYSDGVEREITDNVLALIRTTGDFIHQGREVQMQLISTSNEDNRRKDTGRSRLISVKKFVGSVNTLLQRTRDLASNVRSACEDMDLEKLVSLPEEISASATNIVRQKRAFIETEYSAAVGSNQNILDEMEYLEKKCEDVELAAGDLRKILTRFLFLSPPKSLQKKHVCQVFRTGDESLRDESCSPLVGRSFEPRTPLSTRGRDLLKEQERRSIRKLWSKESPI